MTGLAGHRLHVGDAGADILGRDIGATQFLDRAAERLEQRDPVELAFGPAQHRLGAAKGQAGHGILVAHALGQAAGIVQRRADVGIMPEAAAAGARPDRGAVDGNHAVQPAGGIKQPHRLHRRVQAGRTGNHILLLGMMPPYRRSPEKNLA